MKRLFTVLSAILPLIACKTTTGHKLKKKGEVKIYSTNDSRAPLSKLSEDRALSNDSNKMKAHLKKNPQDTNGWINLAQLQLAQSKYNDAKVSAKKALRTNIKSTTAKKILAQIAVRQNQFSLAEILVNGIGGNRSTDGEVHNIIALIALGKGEPAKAMASFKKALKIDPNNIAVRLNLGLSYLKYRQMREASVQFERVLKIMPNNTDALLHMAIIKASRGNLDEAEDIYDDTLSSDRNNPIALFNLAVLQKKQKEYDTALDNLESYLKKAKSTSLNTDEAFALIERIKDLRNQEDGGGSSDEEIRELADDFDTRDMAKNSADERDDIDTESVDLKVNQDAEIEELEHALME